jgi:hypothetical protein
MTKRFWLGRHRVIFAREPMIGLGFDVDVHRTEFGARNLWMARVWFGPWVLAVRFNERSVQDV